MSLKCKNILKRITSAVMAFIMMFSLVACGASDSSAENSAKPSNVQTQVQKSKDSNSSVVADNEVTDMFSELVVNELEVDGLDVEGLKAEDIIVHCTVVDEITVLETDVVSLNDELVYLAYQNYVSVYGDDIDFGKLLKDVAIGSTCIIVCVTLSTVAGPVGTFFGAVITSEFSASAMVVGAAIDAAVSGYQAYKEGGDVSYIVGHMINGVADGYKWAAILAPVTGGIAGIKALKAVKSLKALDAFKNATDKELNELIKNFSKIAKKTAKEASDISDDALRQIYKEMQSELSSEITEDLFIKAFRNQDSITRYIAKYNPFNTSAELNKVLRENFLSKTGLADDAIDSYVKNFQKKTIKSFDDIGDENVKKYIQENMYEFISCFGPSLSDDFVDDCLRNSLGDEISTALKSHIKDANAYIALVKALDKKTVDNMLKNPDALILIQLRYGTKATNELRFIQGLYKNVVQGDGKQISDDLADEIIDKLLSGKYKSLDDIAKDSIAAADNIATQKEIFAYYLEQIGAKAKNADIIDELTIRGITRNIDSSVISESNLLEIIDKRMGKDQIIAKFGQDTYDALYKNADDVISSLTLQSKVNLSLFDDLMGDSLREAKLSDDTVHAILNKESIQEWGMSDDALSSIWNRVATYYQATDEEAYVNFIDEYVEKRAARAREFLKTHDITINNIQYADSVMPAPNEFIKARYGDIYMNKEGFPVFDKYAIARVQPSGLTGDDLEDIKLANIAHHGNQYNIPGYTWHHLEDGKTLILIPTELHDAYRHTGGAKLLREGF